VLGPLGLGPRPGAVYAGGSNITTGALLLLVDVAGIG